MIGQVHFSNTLLDGNLLVKYWVGSDTMSNHLPILCKIEKEGGKMTSPLNFNHA
jgi:hypothetical protein